MCELRVAGVTATELAVRAGLTTSQLVEGGFTPQECDEGVRAATKECSPVKSSAERPAAFAKLEELWLGRNQIGDEGVTSLADACSSGSAFSRLRELYLYACAPRPHYARMFHTEASPILHCTHMCAHITSPSRAHPVPIPYM